MAAETAGLALAPVVERDRRPPLETALVVPVGPAVPRTGELITLVGQPGSMSDALVIEAGELFVEEILAALEEGRRVLVTTE